jgi:hypothetical protein
MSSRSGASVLESACVRRYKKPRAPGFGFAGELFDRSASHLRSKRALGAGDCCFLSGKGF